jgi:Na+-transporting NADH:ubiquinone oxidoreductase subunit NqrC
LPTPCCQLWRHGAWFSSLLTRTQKKETVRDSEECILNIPQIKDNSLVYKRLSQAFREQGIVKLIDTVCRLINTGLKTFKISCLRVRKLHYPSHHPRHVTVVEESPSRGASLQWIRGYA